ncbi:hypothetical protein [Actinomycetospora cinnamomea]|uniref:Uncharacterized protein n=1 Tax=Actinomycetospora cinnamomea TaxID=663609 RepID=A0A2U1FS59_9PSEU|nr:hypothetical protein [Actinomycetospora cinnamomea]PVZ14999.1 hypothetical protein C8D89_101868 [Actinomycetospora cinnamomea]
MVILGLALRALGPGVKAVALAMAPVAAVLAWGAVQNEMDKRKNKTAETVSGP